MITAGVVVLAVIGWFSLGFLGDSGANQAAAMEMNFIVTGDSASAYNLMSTDFKSATTLSQYAETIKGYQTHPMSSAKLDKITYSKDNGNDLTTATYTVSDNGTDYQLTMELIKQSGNWKVSNTVLTAR